MKPCRVETNGMEMELDRRSLAMIRLSFGGRTWFENPDNGASLWRLHAVDARGRRVDLECGGCRRAEVVRRKDGVELRWTGVAHRAAGAGPFDVTVRLAPVAGRRLLTAWRIDVRNRSGDWTLWHLLFPLLNGLRPGPSPDRDMLFWPEMWGMQTTGWERMKEVSGVCGGYGKHSAQFMGFSHSDRTFYFASHDPEQWPKHMVFKPVSCRSRRSAQIYFLAHPAGMTEAGNSYRQQYEVVLGEIPGDWYDAARTYAQWVRGRPWVSSPPKNAFKGLREEREILVWEQGSINAFPSERVVTVNDLSASKWARQMKTLKRKLGVRMAVHMYHWHQTPFDTNYPEYFPVKQGFKDLVADLQDAGIVIMPYINGRLWDHSAPSYDAQAELHAVKCCAERAAPPLRFAWPESYGNGQLLVTMCLATEFWRRKVVQLCERIVKELGCRGIYLDQLGCSGSRTCVDPRHGHSLGGGSYWLEGYRRLLASIRDRIGPEPYLTTENNWEACVADFDALLDTQWNHEENLPIFPAVYWDRGAIYGGDVFGPAFGGGGETFIQRMGMRCVWGGELGWGHFEHLLKPENRDLLDYFIGLCRLRTDHARFFCRGEFLRPPEVVTSDGTKCSSPLKGPVLSALWSDPDGDGCSLFLVNVTRGEQRVKVRMTDARAAARSPAVCVSLRPLESKAVAL